MVTAAGTLSLIEDVLRDTLADSAAFRTMCKAAGRTAALAKIHLERLPAPADDAQTYTLAEMQEYWAYAIIATDTEEGAVWRRDAASSWLVDATLWLMIGREVPDGYDDAQADLEFKNYVGQILDELCDLADAGEAGGVAYLQFLSAEIVAGPFRSLEDDRPGKGEEQAVVVALKVANVVKS